MTEFTRIFTPRADKAVKAILLLTNGHRYEPTQEEKDRTLMVLKEAVNDIASLYGMLPGAKPDTTCIAPEIAMEKAQQTSEDRIRGQEAAINRAGWPHHSIDARVRSIPENQLSAYITQIMHRMCEVHDAS